MFITKKSKEHIFILTEPSSLFVEILFRLFRLPASYINIYHCLPLIYSGLLRSIPHCNSLHLSLHLLMLLLPVLINYIWSVFIAGKCLERSDDFTARILFFMTYKIITMFDWNRRICTEFNNVTTYWIVPLGWKLRPVTFTALYTTHWTTWQIQLLE